MTTPAAVTPDPAPVNGSLTDPVDGSLPTPVNGSLDPCAYCTAPGCHWTRHGQARADVAAWSRELASMSDPDHTHDSEVSSW